MMRLKAIVEQTRFVGAATLARSLALLSEAARPKQRHGSTCPAAIK